MPLRGGVRRAAARGLLLGALLALLGIGAAMALGHAVAPLVVFLPFAAALAGGVLLQADRQAGDEAAALPAPAGARDDGQGGGGMPGVDGDGCATGEAGGGAGGGDAGGDGGGGGSSGGE